MKFHRSALISRQCNPGLSQCVPFIIKAIGMLSERGSVAINCVPFFSDPYHD